MWTNREVTAMKAVPRRLLILGGGPVGVEMAQAVRRLGGEVALVARSERVLPASPRRWARRSARCCAATASSWTSARARRPRGATGDDYVLELSDGRELRGDRLLVATGRRPRVDGIGLESVGIEPDAHGIPVDASLRAGERLWAIGDVTGLRAGIALVPWLALRIPAKKVAAVAALIATAAYVLLAGATVPTQRAFLMTAIVMLAVLTDRSPFTMRLVASAAGAVALVRPEAVLGASFQMSFAAVTALIAAHESLRVAVAALPMASPQGSRARSPASPSPASSPVRRPRRSRPIISTGSPTTACWPT